MDLKDRISLLKVQIDEKDKQLRTKDEQSYAKDNQINELIQSNLNFTKVLNPPPEEVAATVEVKKSFFGKLFKK